MKKKIVSMLLVAAMVASMAVGCGSKNDSEIATQSLIKENPLHLWRLIGQPI